VEALFETAVRKLGVLAGNNVLDWAFFPDGYARVDGHSAVHGGTSTPAVFESLVGCTPAGCPEDQQTSRYGLCVILCVRLPHPLPPAVMLKATDTGSVEDEDMAREPETIAELRRALGAQLATFRLAAELTQGQLAKVAICDRTTLVHIEKGRARVDERFWRAVDDACDARGALLAGYMELEATKAEHEQQEREQRLAIVRAKAAELRGQPGLTSSHTSVSGGLPVLDDLRHALLGHQAQLDGGPGMASPGAMQVEAGVVQAHRLYQMADYDGAARLLPLVVRRLGADSRAPVPAKVAAYLGAAKLATKLGDAALAWVAADRSLRLATETERHALIGIANYQVACALLGSGHLADAEHTAASAVDQIASDSGSIEQTAEEVLSARGALLLLLAIIAARRGDAPVTQRYLRDANQLADHLGQDGNWLWTAFGPTNIAIHELAVQVALGDSRKALRLGETIDTDGLPTVLRGRRSQVHLELGWASVGQGDDSLAVLHLLEAERVAKQTVSRNATARALLTTLVSRERKSVTPGLRALASRAGVLQ
jgi:DNA-binding XRE family transcriptional regulator